MNKKILNFLKAFRTNFKEQKVYSLSASLTYVTLLGFVPFIIFILFFIPTLPFLRLETQIKDAIIATFVPESADMIYQYIVQLAGKKIPFNIFSFGILIFTSYSLFKIINDTFDNILNIHEYRKKTFFGDIIKFFGMTIFGSLLILILLSTSSLPIISKFYTIPYIQGIFLYFTPFMILFMIFTLGFFYIPTIKVRKRSIMIGAAASSAVWILFKSMFNWYIGNLTNIELIFGFLASIPVFLFWIYANWVIILSGVVLVSILEKRHLVISAPKADLNTVKITLEKKITDKNLEKIVSTTFPRDEMKNVLREILQEETAETREAKKNQFTEKDK